MASGCSCSIRWPCRASSGSSQPGAVVAGDTLLDFGQGLEIPLQWLFHGVTREQVVAGLRPLLELPVELVLPTHGGPTDRAGALSERSRDAP